MHTKLINPLLPRCPSSLSSSSLFHSCLSSGTVTQAAGREGGREGGKPSQVSLTLLMQPSSLRLKPPQTPSNTSSVLLLFSKTLSAALQDCCVHRVKQAQHTVGRRQQNTHEKLPDVGDKLQSGGWWLLPWKQKLDIVVFKDSEMAVRASLACVMWCISEWHEICRWSIISRGIWSNRWLIWSWAWRLWRLDTELKTFHLHSHFPHLQCQIRRWRTK